MVNTKPIAEAPVLTIHSRDIVGDLTRDAPLDPAGPCWGPSLCGDCMEIERRRTKAGNIVQRVRWRDPEGHRRTRTFDTKNDAETFAADLQLRRRLGHLAGIDSGKIILNEYMARTWVRVHAVNLAASTRKTYRLLYANHLRPFLGSHPLRAITVDVIARWQADRLRDGVGPTSVRKSLVLLSGILQTAVQAEHLTVNPARMVRKAQLPHRAEVRPLAPAAVEALRAAARNPAPTTVAASSSGKRRRRAYTVTGPGTLYIRLRDATLISVLAYSGIRPQEALALRWSDIRENTLLIDAPWRATGSNPPKPQPREPSASLSLWPMTSTTSSSRRADR